MSNKNNKKSVVKKQVRVVDEKQVPSSTTTTAKRKIALNSPKDYSSSSQIAKAYAAGCFPNFVHQKLFHALLQAKVALISIKCLKTQECTGRAHYRLSGT